MLERNQRKGITLISLVITIILLLILATVAINLAVDSDGLFSKAGDAANKWNSSVAEEDRTLGNLMTMLNTLNGGSTGNEPEGLTLGDVYSEEMQGQSVTYSANGQDEWIILGEDPEKAGHILITTKLPVVAVLNKHVGTETWLYFVDDMHEACSVYGGRIGGIEVESRSITMEDINRVTGFEEPEFDTITFGITHDVANKKLNYMYPKSGSSWISSNGAEHVGWKKPEIENEITFEENAYSYDDAYINPIKGDLIWGEENNLYYNTADISLYYGDEYVFYGMGTVCEGAAGTYYGPWLEGGISYLSNIDISSTPDGAVGEVPVRPVVSVPANVPVEEVNGVYDFVQID